MVELESLRPHASRAIRLWVRMVWADGRVPTQQLDALVALAEVLGRGDLVGPLLVRRRDGGAIVPWAPGELDERLAAAIYAVASWLAHVDGEAHSNERMLLDQIGDALGLNPVHAERLETLARNVAALAPGPRLRHAEALLYGALRLETGLTPSAGHAA